MFKTHLKAVFGIFVASIAISFFGFLMAFMAMPEDIFTLQEIVNDSFDFAKFQFTMYFSVMAITYTIIQIIQYCTKSD